MALPVAFGHLAHGAPELGAEVEVGVLTFLVVLVMLAGVAFLVLAMIDLVRRPARAWEASGHNQLVWALIVVFVGFIGPILYLAIARPALDRAMAEA
jgi:hypothetical protein